MRRAQSLQSARGAQVAQTFMFPPATGGMNNRDPAITLPANESPYMINCYPTVSGIQSRKGYASHVTGMPAITKALMVYTPTSGTEAMFAASGTALYDVTSAGAVGAAVVSGLANSNWQYVNFTNSSSTSYLCCFNGADSPRYWDGATWTAITGASTPAITGLTTTTIQSAFVHQRRMWLVQNNSLKVWYLPIDSVGGAANALDLGGIATLGGYVIAGSTWTIDAADGADDYWVVVTSQGQMIAFAGTDPSSASTWTHVGTWNISIPMSVLSLYKYRGDLLILTNVGVLSARAIMSGASNVTAAISDKITNTFATLTTGANRASLIEDQAADLLIFNSGNFSGANYYCYPMNRTTGAWGGGWDLGMTTAAVMGGSIYYSTQYATDIIRKMTGVLDAGSAIEIQFQTGLSDFGAGPFIKNTSLGRILGYFANTPSIGVSVSADNTGVTVPTLIARTITVDGFDMFLPLGDVGSTFAFFIRASSTTTMRLIGFQTLYTPGGLVGAYAGS